MAFTPREPEARRGVALCLSGGGYRAALFHLGALRRLNELGVLGRVDTITSVSGGSILAAFLATRLPPWPGPGERIAEWDAAVREPFRAVTRRNIRTLPLLSRAWPWNWFRSSAPARALVREYQKHLTAATLPELPARPRFIICATDMQFGVNWIFDSGLLDGRRGRAGDYLAGYASPFPDWPVAFAVGASSCSPPFFDPLPVGLKATQLRRGAYRKRDRDDLVGDIRLSDGGVYDNLGLEPVWKDHRTLLVSDGGSVFEADTDAGFFWRLNRYVSIIGSQASAMRKRWLISSFISNTMDGAYWGIGSATRHYFPAAEGYSAELVDEVISEVRSDLDAFSDVEAAVLENHGYLLADVAARRHAQNLVAADAAPPQIPHPDWMDEERVRRALAGSEKRTLLGRW